MFISVQGPKRIKQGEHMSLRISVFNYWDEEMDILVSIKKSADYKFAAYDVNRGSTEQAVAVDGEHQVMTMMTHLAILLMFVVPKLNHASLFETYSKYSAVVGMNDMKMIMKCLIVM